jgi:hypothetical protein
LFVVIWLPSVVSPCGGDPFVVLHDVGIRWPAAIGQSQEPPICLAPVVRVRSRSHAIVRVLTYLLKLCVPMYQYKSTSVGSDRMSE